MKHQQTPPVLIVGAGPVGQLAALLLSRHGVQTHLVDRRMEPLSAPKAHAVNPRTLEICESIGVSADRLRSLGASANDGGDVRFVGTLCGPQFGVLPYERQDEAAFADTPFPLSNIPQPVFEAELLAKIQSDTNIHFQRGIECTDLSDDGEGVEVTLLESETGVVPQERYQYVIAADGAGSRVRDILGISMEGPESLQDFLMIHFSADLRSFTKNRRGVLYFLFAPGVHGTLIAYDQSKTWVLMHPFRKTEERIGDYTDEYCRELINRAVGTPVPGAVIENVSPWTMTAQIASDYAKGRTFFIGDAAHRFPPAGGLGLNTGAGDAQNLTWKLAAVLNGRAGSKLLDTYEVERRPVAKINSDQSLTNSAKLFELIDAIYGSNPEPEQVAQHYAAVAENPSAFPALTAAVEAQKPHFDSFSLQLGYRYSSAAIFEPAPIPGTENISNYQPSWDAGAHFPHYWLGDEARREPLQAHLPADRFSLLCGPDAVKPSGDDYCQPVCFGSEVVIDRDWTAMTGLPGTGAVLIRPDGHIAARFQAVTSETLESVTNTLLCREN